VGFLPPIFSKNMRSRQIGSFPEGNSGCFNENTKDSQDIFSLVILCHIQLFLPKINHSNSHEFSTAISEEQG